MATDRSGFAKLAGSQQTSQGSEEIQLTAFSGIGRGFVRCEGPEGHSTAMFILTNRQLAGQQVFWNGSGTAKSRDFRSILRICGTVPVRGSFQAFARLRSERC
jgi:hypothetical protein